MPSSTWTSARARGPHAPVAPGRPRAAAQGVRLSTGPVLAGVLAPRRRDRHLLHRRARSAPRAAPDGAAGAGVRPAGDRHRTVAWLRAAGQWPGAVRLVVDPGRGRLPHLRAALPDRPAGAAARTPIHPAQ